MNFLNSVKCWPQNTVPQFENLLVWILRSRNSRRSGRTHN